MLFDKAKKAHEVLCDPHRRAIYDTMGIKGLETDGWEVVQRTKTPQEIREEYERLAQVAACTVFHSLSILLFSFCCGRILYRLSLHLIHPFSLQEREERRLNQRTNPKGSMSIGIDATELFSPYDPYQYETEYSIPTIELSSLRWVRRAGRTLC